MVLEATVIILDNSEWMRNGDYIPSRMDAQLDAAHILCNTKRQANVESSVAIMTMGGSSPKVLVTLTNEAGKLQHALASTRFEGQSRCNFKAALQVAQLILKNRQNSNQRQRIVVFVGSPLQLQIESELQGLKALGKLLKKNGVTLDVISFGHHSDNEIAIAEILAAVAGLDSEQARKNIMGALLEMPLEGEEGCHLLVVSPGVSIQEELMTSPILLGSDGSGAGVGGAFGMDEELDPELAMALKLSLEEEKARIEREKATGKGTEIEMAIDEGGNNNSNNIDEEDEDAMMAKAIALSMESNNPPRSSTDQSTSKDK